MRIENIKYEFPEMPEEIKNIVKREVENQIHNGTAGYAGNPAGQKQTAGYTDISGSRFTGTGSRRVRRMSARRAAVIGLAAAMALGTTVFAGSRLYQMYSEQVGNYGVKTAVIDEEALPEAGKEANFSSGSDAADDTISGSASDAADGSIFGSANDAADGTISGTGTDAADGSISGTGSDAADGDGAGTDIATKKDAVSAVSSGTEIPDVKLKLNYLPEGMVQRPFESLKFGYESDTELQGGISICAYSMDTGDDSFEITDFNIISKEEINDSGREIIYLEKQRTVSGETQGIIYAFFPEVHHVLQMWCGPDVSKDEAVKVAEGIELIPLEDGETSDIGLNWAWSSFLELQQETEMSDDFSGRKEAALQNAGSAHIIGETFTVPGYCYDENGKPVNVDCITANVVSVQTADDLSLLGDSEYIDSSWLESVDENGKLLPNEIQYIKSGDGINTLDETVKTEEVAQKLVYVTVDYTNTGDTVLKDINFYASLETICEGADGYTIYDRALQTENANCDQTLNTGCVFYGEMQFFDYYTSGDHNGLNYIDVLNPGETVTIHMAWIANEDELQYLYLNFNGDSYDASGLVDIRQ